MYGTLPLPADVVLLEDFPVESLLGWRAGRAPHLVDAMIRAAAPAADPDP
jgi:hypothetical protein